MLHRHLDHQIFDVAGNRGDGKHLPLALKPQEAVPGGDVPVEEEAARSRIVRYEPRNDREAKLKLTYIAAYLMATKRTLKTIEMAAVIGTT